LIEPMLEITPLAWNAAAALHRKQAILLTSPNATEALLRAAHALATGDLAALPPVLTAGTATAGPLRRAGLTRVEAAPRGGIADLVRFVQSRLDPRRGPLAYLSGETVACDLAGALAPADFAAEPTMVYAARSTEHIASRARSAIGVARSRWYLSYRCPLQPLSILRSFERDWRRAAGAWSASR
jgi:uroporphyrinogen-III synthase